MRHELLIKGHESVLNLRFMCVIAHFFPCIPGSQLHSTLRMRGATNSARDVAYTFPMPSVT